MRARPKEIDDKHKAAAEREEKEELANLEQATQSTDEEATLQISAGLNSDHVNVVGFIVGKLIAQSGNGSNWSGKIQFLSEAAGAGSSNNLGAPFASNRVLVR